MLNTVTEMKNAFGWHNGRLNVAKGKMNKLEGGQTETYQNDTHRDKKWEEKEKKIEHQRLVSMLDNFHR